MKKDTEKSGAQTVQRAVRLLKYISRYPDDGARLMDIAGDMGLERPTVHRVLQALAAEGLVRQDAARKYRVGPLVFQLNLMSGGYFNLADVCMPRLRELAQDTEDTSFLFVRYGDDAICLARKQGSYHIQTPVVPVNSCHPLGVSAGGLAILGALPEAEAAMVLERVAPRLSAYKGLTVEEVWERYEDMRNRGYCVIADRVAPGVKGVGVPIRNELGSPIAAVTVATTISRMTDERVLEVGPMLHLAAASLAEQIQVRFAARAACV